MPVQSTMLELGTRAPHFALPDTDGRTVASDDFADAPALLVMFLSNHCPFVKHLTRALADLARDYAPRGVAIVGIMSNDVVRHPADAPERMAEARAAWGWTFPYLYDETQEVARAYRAACTPDIYLFDGERRLVYRGQVDDSRPNNGMAPTGAHLRAALDAVLDGRPVPAEQRPGIGCNIKWKPGAEPEWFR
ncbi:thioredoxin family protein [Longimicrobium sp.]|uniref:thioredoxin family protein n=1 Tax=Longimicrobium sp. TaxID=2029185 RepID=UPI003B3A85E7